MIACLAFCSSCAIAGGKRKSLYGAKVLIINDKRPFNNISAKGLTASLGRNVCFIPTFYYFKKEILYPLKEGLQHLSLRRQR